MVCLWGVLSLCGVIVGGFCHESVFDWVYSSCVLTSVCEWGVLSSNGVSLGCVVMNQCVIGSRVIVC